MSRPEKFRYRKEKKISIQFGEEKQDFLLIALSARQTEQAMNEAQECFQKQTKNLTQASEAISDLYQLQERAMLEELFLEGEMEALRQKAEKTLVQDGEDYEERLQKKIGKLKEQRKEELVETSTEELVTVITQREINSQREQLWYYNTLVASLSQALHDEEGKSVFLSMEELKEELAPEQIDQLLEIWLEFLNTRGNAQVFPEPCTFKG